MSYTWRSILQARWVIKKGSFWTIGNGSSIDLWAGNWIHQRCHTSTWSATIPASTTYQKVQGIIDNNGNGWKVQVINQLFTPQEAQKILQIPIIDKSQEDTLTWDGTPDANCTIKTSYQAIIDWE
jgi:hypothetical protein